LVSLTGCGEGASGCEGTVCPCTDKGIRAAIAAGGGPYTFACDGPTALAAIFTIDNDVILDGAGQLSVFSFEVAVGVTAELRAFEIAFSIEVPVADWTGIYNGGTLKITDSSVSGFDGGGISNTGTLELVSSSVSSNWWGGIFNTGTLTITDSIISRNRTGDLGGGGAGIFNSGTLRIANSTISENFAWYGDLHGGGGIYNSGSVSIVASTVSRNEDTSEHGGGAIQNDGGLVTVTNSTISENAAAGPGGGILNSGTLMIINSTVSANTADEGGAIHNDGTAIATNSVIEGSCSGSAALESGARNIESPADTCGFNQPTDQTEKTPEELKLEPLADNGGPTETHALLPGSVAINKIPADGCVDTEGAPLTTDQRGEPRPETGGTACDVGAFEVQP